MRRLCLLGAAITVTCWNVALGCVTVAAVELQFRTTEEGQYVIEATKLSAEAIARVSSWQPKDTRWREVFLVQVGNMPQADRPGMLGSYHVRNDSLRFVPQFPLQRGLEYCARYQDPATTGDGDQTSQVVAFQVPSLNHERAQVTAVYPSGDELPENLLRFYLHFSAPMKRGNVYQYVRIERGDGSEVELPFVEIEQELWSLDGHRLTLLLDPGRIKRGLKPREEVGPVLEEGKSYTLVIDQRWPDALGQSLGRDYRKLFRVTAPDDGQPTPRSWELHPPSAGTRVPLTVVFPEPLDHAMLGHVLTVLDQQGHALEGTVTIGSEETSWQWTPRTPWQAGRYQLQVDATLEDRAGNSITRLFEVDVFNRVDRQVATETKAIPFEVSSSN
ncbi:MAG: hypothetical protein KDA60_03595 [Planctomycetales bacterium]|nr:hypothetical protein [Planctomycetales bacterium]